MLIISNIPSQIFHNNLYHFGFGEKGFNYFWEFVIFATFFNILARIFNQCNFYLVGAFGFLVLSFTQLVCSLIFIRHLIIGFSSRQSRGKQLLINNY
uniref:Uncharacterized protein n=1 Tax=Panagrolaimus superbus TaxID=310955 RepID=A0A914YZK7_9BILA